MFLMVVTMGVNNLMYERAKNSEPKVTTVRQAVSEVKADSQEVMLGKLERLELEELRSEKEKQKQRIPDEVVSVVVPTKEVEYYMDKYATFKGIVRRSDGEKEIVISTVERQDKAEKQGESIQEVLNHIARGDYPVIKKVWVSGDYSQVAVRVDNTNPEKVADVNEYILSYLLDRITEYRAISDKGGYEVELVIKDDSTDEEIEKTKYPKQ